MELTLKRIGFAALALAAILLPLRQEPRESITSSTSDRALRLDSLYWQRSEAHISWSAFELRDSAIRVAAAAHPGASEPAVAWHAFPGNRSNAGADSVIAELWNRIGTTNPNVNVSALLYNDATYTRPSYVGALITTTGARTNCVAISPARSLPNGKVEVWGYELAQALAPCAVLAAFGPPGASVAAWLTQTAYASVQSNLWLVPRAAEFTRSPWAEWSDAWRGARPPVDLFSLMQSTGLVELAMLMRSPYDYGAAGLRCINGDEGACVTGVLHPAIVLPTSDSMPGDLTLSSWSTAPKNTTLATVRPAGPQMISALITEFGRERFEKFWISTSPFETAFHDAFGETLGSWTARWARHEWLGTYEAKRVNADILLGVTLKASWLPPIVGWSVVALAIAAMVARRRTA